MGVHDYTCAFCGTPESYACHEQDATDEPCVVAGFGQDEALLTFFHFPAASAPEDVDAFRQAASRALRRETFEFRYDWGDWEFEPSLNYRDLLMDDEDAAGIWPLGPHALSNEDPVEVEVPADEAVWIVNCCPPCWRLFVRGEAGVPCKLHLEAVGEHLGLEPTLEALQRALAGAAWLPGCEAKPPTRVERPEFHQHKQAEAEAFTRQYEAEQRAREAEAADPERGRREAIDEDHGDFDQRRPGGFQRF